jgi:hypothetical protein
MQLILCFLVSSSQQSFFILQRRKELFREIRWLAPGRWA